MPQETEELHAAIGSVIVSFNALEDRISSLLLDALALEGDRMKDALCASMSFSQKVDLLCALVIEDNELPPAEKARRTALLKDAVKFEEARNTIVHSQYGRFAETTEELARRKVKTKGQKGLQVQLEKVDLKKIQAVSSDITLWLMRWWDL